MKIRYMTGNDGEYEAHRTWTSGGREISDSTDRVVVYRGVDRGWQAWYWGNPLSVAHPDTRYVDEKGDSIQECNCPRVEVEGVFATRDAAAEAGWQMKRDSGEYVHHSKGPEVSLYDSHFPTP